MVDKFTLPPIVLRNDLARLLCGLLLPLGRQGALCFVCLHMGREWGRWFGFDSIKFHLSFAKTIVNQITSQCMCRNLTGMWSGACRWQRRGREGIQAHALPMGPAPCYPFQNPYASWLSETWPRRWAEPRA